MQSFYKFLIDEGQQCGVTPTIPRKSMFSTGWPEIIKISPIDNLARRGCNNLPITTYILCYSMIETVDHLFLHCLTTTFLWNHFAHILNLHSTPNSLTDCGMAGARALFSKFDLKGILPFLTLLVMSLSFLLLDISHTFLFWVCAIHVVKI